MRAWLWYTERLREESFTAATISLDYARNRLTGRERYTYTAEYWDGNTVTATFQTHDEAVKHFNYIERRMRPIIL